LGNNAPLPPSFPILVALFEGSLWHLLGVIRRVIDDVFHSLKVSFLRAILDLGNRKMPEREKSGE
jgi:hypothetical protein